MEVGQQRAHRLELETGVDEQIGFAAHLAQSAAPRRRLQCPRRCRSHCQQAGRGPHHRGAVLGYREPLRVQAGLLDHFGVKRLKRAKPDVQRNLGHRRACRAALRHHLRREVQTRGGSGNRATLACEHRLVALAVLGPVRAVNVGRQRDVAVPVQSGVHVTLADQPNDPLAVLTPAKYFHLDSLAGNDPFAAAHLAARVYQGQPGFPLAVQRPNQEHFHLSPETGAVTIKAGGKDLRIIQYQAVAVAEVLRQLAKHPVFPPARLSIHQQHSRGRTVAQGRLRNQFLRQVIIEVSNQHPNGQHSNLRILGIETSCDESAAAVLEDGNRILSSVVASQLDVHGKYGGVVPELASREHLRAIVPVVREALEQASAPLAEIAAVAVTQGPGLVGSLLVGITYAKALCFARGIPLIAVNHIEGHIHAVVLDARLQGNPVGFPALALVASGGHTHLFSVTEAYQYRLLGRTRDDAAGEAFDKVAKLLGFNYPGGPVIDMLAPYGDGSAVRFSPAKMKGNPLDFSFSGIKTAVLRWTEQNDLATETEVRRALLRTKPRPSLEEWLAVTPRRTLDLLASFQRTVIRELLSRAALAAEQEGARSLIISGGVACNTGLRAEASRAPLPCPVFFPAPALSTDNAAMIAAAAFPKFQRGEFAAFDLAAQANLTLT